MDADRIIATLRGYQGDTSDYAFARRVGMSRAMWRALRTGERRPGPATLAQIRIAFPELARDCEAAHLARLSAVA